MSPNRSLCSAARCLVAGSGTNVYSSKRGAFHALKSHDEQPILSTKMGPEAAKIAYSPRNKPRCARVGARALRARSAYATVRTSVRTNTLDECRCKRLIFSANSPRLLAFHGARQELRVPWKTPARKGGRFRLIQPCTRGVEPGLPTI